MSLFIDEHKCKRDGICVAECPLGLIQMPTEGQFPCQIEEAQELCIKCGHCVAVCPNAALELDDIKPQTCPPVRKDLLLSPEHAEHFLRFRRSIRNYKGKPIERDILRRLIEVASFAPSGHNRQPVHWLVVENREALSRISGHVVDWMRTLIQDHPEIASPMHLDRVVAAWERGQDRILRGAPCLIVAHAAQAERTAQSSCTIALTYLELAATAFGLGTCWAGYFNAAATLYPPLQETLQLPENHLSFGAMMIGYQKYAYFRLPPRKPTQDRMEMIV